jgi:hypothetical protein
VFAAETATEIGRPPRSDSAWIFEPGLPRSTGLGPVREPPFRAHAGTVHDRMAPVDQTLAAEFVQNPRGATAATTRFGPLPEAAVRGLGRHPERRREIPPHTPAAQQVHDRREHRAGIQRRVPPPCGRDPNTGISGSASSHSSSGTNLSDNRSTTAKIIAHQWSITT